MILHLLAYGLEKGLSPSLDRLLARGSRGKGLPEGLEAALMALFGLPPGGEGAIAALGEGLPAPEGFLRADPVALRPYRDRLILLSGALFPFTLEEARRWGEALQGLLGDWALAIPSPYRWYLRAPLRLEAEPISSVWGKDIAFHLPRGEDALLWQARLTEIEMCLHGLGAPVNSLWLWGGGRLPGPLKVPWERLWCASPLGRGLAKLASIPYAVPPEDGERWLLQAETGRHLMVWEDILWARAHGEAWHEGLEARWMAPLLRALAAGRLKALVLYPAPGLALSLTRLSLWRFWRRA